MATILGNNTRIIGVVTKPGTRRNMRRNGYFSLTILAHILSIDETSLSNGELYTILTNKEGKGKKGALIGMIEGTNAESVINVINRIPEQAMELVKEVTLDMAGSMNKIVRHCFQKASLGIDQFHVQKLAYDALQEMRTGHRWDAINEETNAKENAKLNNEKYIAPTLCNGDTRKQLLARSRYLLFKSGDKWTQKQKERAKILFDQYLDIKGVAARL